MAKTKGVQIPTISFVYGHHIYWLVNTYSKEGIFELRLGMYEEIFITQITIFLATFRCSVSSEIQEKDGEKIYI